LSGHLCSLLGDDGLSGVIGALAARDQVPIG
jgi:hypothetical protein